MFLHSSRILPLLTRPKYLSSTYFFSNSYDVRGVTKELTTKPKPKSEVLQHNRFLHTSATKCKEDALQHKLIETLSVLKTVKLNELKSAPFPAILYGFGGIVPFVFPPLYFIVGSFSPFLATSQLMYGATILAFVGGVKWGNALAKSNVSHEQIGISTVPSLVAWTALLVPEPLGFLIVSSGLGGALVLDLTSSGYPPWFNAIRTCLTGVAVTSLMVTFICHILH